jgi:hypothetical protein
MPFQTAIATILMDATVNGTTYPTWGNIFASLHSTTLALSETSAFTGEVTGGTYLRQDITAAWAAAANGAAANDVAVEFTLMPATTVYTFCIATSSSAGGTQLWQTTLTASKTLSAGDTLRFAVGALTATST